LIRARTIGQIVALIAEHLGAERVNGAPVETAALMMGPEPASSDEVDLEALSDEEIEGLLGNDADSRQNDEEK